VPRYYLKGARSHSRTRPKAETTQMKYMLHLNPFYFVKTATKISQPKNPTACK